MIKKILLLFLFVSCNEAEISKITSGQSSIEDYDFIIKEDEILRGEFAIDKETSLKENQDVIVVAQFKDSDIDSICYLKANTLYLVKKNDFEAILKTIKVENDEMIQEDCERELNNFVL